MQKRPLAFKGPIDHLSRSFDEELLFQGLDLLLNDHIEDWHYQESSECVVCRFRETDDSPSISTNLFWPLTNEIGECSCELTKPCLHMAALAIETKRRLHRIQLQMKDVQTAPYRWVQWVNWLNTQKFDPYPNMARHRLVYLLKVEGNQCFLSLAKAYLNKDGSYTKKSDFPIELAFKQSLPKFVTLEDRRILQIFWDVFSTELNFDPSLFLLSVSLDLVDKVLPLVFKTRRCFWRTCHAKPLHFNETTQLTSNAISIIGNYYFEKQQGIVRISTNHLDYSIESNYLLNEVTAIKPIIILDTVHVALDWLPKNSVEMDIAHIWFAITVNDTTKRFSYSQIKQLTTINDQIKDAIASYSKQLEAIPTIAASQESPISEQFDLNDRCLFEDFGHTAITVRALQTEGWKVEFSEAFRFQWQNSLDTKQVAEHDWFIHLNDDELNESGWFDLELGIIVDGQSINLIPIILKSLRSGQIKLDSKDEFFLVRLEDKGPLLLPRERLLNICSTLTELLDNRLLAKTDKLQLPANQVSRLSQLSLAVPSEHSDGKEHFETKDYQWQGATWLKDKANKLVREQFKAQYQPPENLKAELRDYQQHGLSWLQFLDSFGFSGILADDMGLGKTLQSLAFILSLKNQQQLNAPCLVVVPTSLLSNWQTEIRRYTPDLSSIVISGQARRKLWSIAHQYDVIIISYGQLLRDGDNALKQDFRLVILDEAQTIKNHRTKIANLVYQLSSVQRLCLTGTPLENHLSELWSLFHFLMPGFLGDQRQFKRLFQDPIEKEYDHLRQQALTERIAPFMLRRTKSKVAQELPPKTVMVEWIELDQNQRDLYEIIRTTMDEKVREAIHQNSRGSNQLLISNAILRLRQVCCHPKLLSMESAQQVVESAKLNWLTTVLPEMKAEGRKVLLFSQFTSMLDLIGEQLSDLGISHLLLTGQTKKRSELVERFQQGNTDVFLISLKAGGVGLNLTAADTVIHFDPWWNPAAVEQASDRAYRIGQDKPVFVYQLLTKGTVEERIHRMQKYKTQLAEKLYQQDSMDVFEMDQNDWLSLLEPLPEVD